MNDPANLPHPATAWLPVLAALACGLSTFLLYHAVATGATLPGCGGNSGCNAVLGSRWARWLNIPVAGMAAGCYAIFMILALLHRHHPQPVAKRMASWALTAIALFGLGSILWFVGLQLVVIKKICAWCMTDHALGACTFLLALWGLRVNRDVWIRAGLPAGAALAAFIAVQILFPPMLMDIHGQETGAATGGGQPPAETANIQLGQKKASREVALYNGELKFDIYKVPVLGKREASYVIIELFDYTCKHCRALHPQMLKAQRRYGLDNFAIVPMPVPLNAQCNSSIVRALPDHRYACAYAQYGLAINAIAPDKFEDFHNWMMEGAQVPLLSEVRNRAHELVGKEAFDAAIKSQLVKDWIADGVAIFKYFNADRIPKLITDKRTANVVPTSLENLYIGLDKLTELKPKQ